MKPGLLYRPRVRHLLRNAAASHILVVGDVMLDHFMWGSVGRISPEAPVPIVELQRESFMPGGAGNVARNLRVLGAPTKIYGVIGTDSAGQQLRELLAGQHIGCAGLLQDPERPTSVKTRVVAHTQQVVRIDREKRDELSPATEQTLLHSILRELPGAGALIIGDYGKGVVTQSLLNSLREPCRRHGVWLSLDPKPVHQLNLEGFSLITPNRKEAFELAGMRDEFRGADPRTDSGLMKVASRLLEELRPALLLITLGEQGVLLCQRGQTPFHIPTLAQEVFDVSGAGDTVIACFTLAVVGGASPLEAAMFANHAAGIVVGKVGTAAVSPEELITSFPAQAP